MIVNSRVSQPVLKTFLWVAIVLSALLVVWSTNYCRDLVGELMHLETVENELKIQRGQYLLQEGMLSSPARLEQAARERLGMHIPNSVDMRVIRK